MGLASAVGAPSSLPSQPTIRGWTLLLGRSHFLRHLIKAIHSSFIFLSRKVFLFLFFSQKSVLLLDLLIHLSLLEPNSSSFRKIGYLFLFPNASELVGSPGEYGSGSGFFSYILPYPRAMPLPACPKLMEHPSAQGRGGSRR